MITRTDVIARLKAIEPHLRARGAALYLFGSFARDEAKDGSDVDVFVEPGDQSFYALSNFVVVFDAIRAAIPRTRDRLRHQKRALAIHS